MGEGKYIYGVIKTNERTSYPSPSPLSPPLEGGEGRGGGDEVHTINYQDIACVMSNSPLQDYSSMVKEALGHLLVRHQKIVEKIMTEHTIIPVKFGTFVSDNDEVTQVLKSGYPQFKELLSTMDGKMELDVAAIWNGLNSIIKEIGEEDKKIREFKAEIAKKPPSQTFQDKIKIGMMIKNALDKKREKEQGHIIDSLKEVTVDSQPHQVMDDKMILNCAFLLEKVKEPDFDTGLKELDKEYKQKVNFRCVGPLPPYSFATCQLKKVNYSQLNEARKLLGLEENASLEEIKESYHQLAQKNHPDKHPESSQLKEKFEKMTHAYKLLTNCYQGGNIIPENNKQKDFIMVEIIRP